MKTGSKEQRTYKAKWVIQKKKELKVVDKEDVVGKEIRAIKKKPSTLHRNRKDRERA